MVSRVENAGVIKKAKKGAKMVFMVRMDAKKHAGYDMG